MELPCGKVILLEGAIDEYSLRAFADKNEILFIVESEYRNALSEGVLRLQESGKLAALKIKWWKEKKGGGACSVISLYHIVF